MHGGVTVPSKPKKPCAYPGCPASVTEVSKGQDNNTKRIKTDMNWWISGVFLIF